MKLLSPGVTAIAISSCIADAIALNKHRSDSMHAIAPCRHKNLSTPSGSEGESEFFCMFVACSFACFYCFAFVADFAWWEQALILNYKLVFKCDKNIGVANGACEQPLSLKHFNGSFASMSQ